MPLPSPSRHRRPLVRPVIASALATFAIALSALVAPADVHAQAAERSPAESPAPRRRLDRANLLSVQPLHAVFGAYSGEYERLVGGLVSIGGAVTYTDGEVFDWEDYGDEESSLSTDVKLRFYPDAPSFHGLSLGLQAGARRDREYQAPGDPSLPGAWESRWNPTIGFVIEHGWLDRRSGRVLVATGIGAKRVMRSGTYRDDSYLTLRLSVGYAW